MKLKHVLFVAGALFVGATNAANVRKANADSATGGDEPEDDTKKVWSPDFTSHSISTEAEGEKFYQELKGKCQKLQTETKKARLESKNTCKIEIEETEKYVHDGIKAGADILTAKKKSQKDLLDALYDRHDAHIIALYRLVGNSKATNAEDKIGHYQRLGETIKTANKLWKYKHDENQEYIHGSLSILKILAEVSFGLNSPKLRPIKNFADFVAPQEKSAASSLIEVSKGTTSSTRIMQHLMKQMEHITNVHEEDYNKFMQECLKRGGAQGIPCDKARMETFELWAKAVHLQSKLLKDFEKVRSILKLARVMFESDLPNKHKCWENPCQKVCQDTSKPNLPIGLIHYRKCRAQRLKEQIDRVKKAMARDETFDGRRLKEHEAILKRVCPKHEANSIKEEKKITELCKIIDTFHSSPKKKYGITGGATGSSF